MTTRLAGISVFLPSHNEAGNVARVVAGFLRELPRIARDYEVIVVDDGSNDQTGAIADRIAAEDPHVKVVHHQVNRGYGAAVASGLRAASLPYVLLCDGDGQFDPADAARLAAMVPEYDVVAGHRTSRADSRIRRFNGAAWTLLMRMLLGIRISDVDCGFKLFKREFLDGVELRAGGAMISAELMARLAGRRAKIAEVDVNHLPRLSGEQSGADLKVILRAFRELLTLYRDLHSAHRRG